MLSALGLDVRGLGPITIARDFNDYSTRKICRAKRSVCECWDLIHFQRKESGSIVDLAYVSTSLVRIIVWRARRV